MAEWTKEKERKKNSRKKGKQDAFDCVRTINIVRVNGKQALNFLVLLRISIEHSSFGCCSSRAFNWCEYCCVLLLHLSKGEVITNFSPFFFAKRQSICIEWKTRKSQRNSRKIREKVNTNGAGNIWLWIPLILLNWGKSKRIIVFVWNGGSRNVQWKFKRVLNGIVLLFAISSNQTSDLQIEEFQSFSLSFSLSSVSLYLCRSAKKKNTKRVLHEHELKQKQPKINELKIFQTLSG